MNQSKSLKELLFKDELIVAPGAYDCISAKLIEQAGFLVVYMTGGGTAASRLGVPDYGLITMTEMVENAANIADAVQIPVIADADTGFGNELNVIRTVHKYEKSGVAAIHIEDQIFPKKCGHLGNKEIVNRDEFLSKIRAAVNERQNKEFVIIARTDSRAVVNLDEAVERMNAALELGADIAMIEAPETIEEIREIPSRVKGPCLLGMVLGGKTPTINPPDVQKFGYKIMLVPNLLIIAMAVTCDMVLKNLKEKNELPVAQGNLSIKESFRRMGSDKWEQLQLTYAPHQNKV